MAHDPHSVAVHVLDVPLIADRVAAPRLVYGGLETSLPDGADTAYDALYFDVADSADLGRVTFEGLDAVRAARGEYLPYPSVRYQPGDWVYEVDGSRWLSERHDYEMQHYSTSLLGTHRHYVFVFHDYFVEAIAEGIWIDVANRADPFAPPRTHPLAEFPLDAPAESFTSAEGLTWELRRSPRPLDEIEHGSRLCSQRLFQFNLVLDGRNTETASIWVRTVDGTTTSHFRFFWPTLPTTRIDGIAGPHDVAVAWNSYLNEVAERRRRMHG